MSKKEISGSGPAGIKSSNTNNFVADLSFELKRTQVFVLGIRREPSIFSYCFCYYLIVERAVRITRELCVSAKRT